YYERYSQDVPHSVDPVLRGRDRFLVTCSTAEERGGEILETEHVPGSIKGMTGFGDPATWKNQGSKSVVSSVRRKDTGSCLFSRSSSGRLPTERYKDTISVITNGSRRTVDRTDRPRIAFEKTSLPASKPFPRLRVMK